MAPVFVLKIGLILNGFDSAHLRLLLDVCKRETYAAEWTSSLRKFIESSCVFGTYRAPATTIPFLSAISANPATIRIDRGRKSQAGRRYFECDFLQSQSNLNEPREERPTPRAFDVHNPGIDNRVNFLKASFVPPYLVVGKERLREGGPCLPY